MYELKSNNGVSGTRNSDPSNYNLVHMLFRDEMVDNCFRILPEGCSYEGEAEDRLK